MNIVENPTAEPVPTEDPTDSPAQGNLGMRLFVFFIVLMGALLIIDLLRAWIGS